MKKTLLALALTLAGMLPAQAATAILFDDDFSADSAPLSGFSYLTVTSLNQWNITQGNVDILGPGYCAGCLDLDGSSSPAPAILETKATLTFLANTVYTFNLFFAGGSAVERVTLSVGQGGTSTTAGSGASVYTKVGQSATTFQSTVMLSLSGPADNFGPYLDRVLITYDTPDVPLPAAAPLLLAGIGGLVALRRKRRT